MKVKYVIDLHMEVYHEKEDGELKSALEYGEDVAHFIADEVSTTGGYTSIDVVNAKLEV